MSYFDVVKYNNNLYQIKDRLGVLSTLVIGENKALLFDTCYGVGNLKEEVEKITNKPLIVVNSHGHMDHTGGNYQFPEVYLHENDFELVKKHNSEKWRQRTINTLEKNKITVEGFSKENYLKQREGNIIPLKLHEIFDLGGVTCEVLPLFGHTQGSIALYIKEWKLALVSDGTCPFIWIFLEESTTVTVYVKYLKELLKYDFDNFLVGHGARLLPRERMYAFLKIAEEIDLSKSVKVSFDNFDDLNSYCFTHDRMYDQDGCGIIFDPNKL